MPSEVTSITAYLHPAFAAPRKNRWIFIRPGIVILRRFRSSLGPILKRTEDMEATGYPACSRISAIQCTVVVFPLVPVTPMTNKEREGKRKNTAPISDHKK